MRCLALISVSFLLFASRGGSETSGPMAALPALRQPFDQALNEAMATYDRQTGDLRGTYLGAIDSLAAERRQGGDLGAVVALRLERARFLTESNTVTETAQTDHPDVRRLKRQFLQQRTGLVTQRDDTILRAAGAYTNQLALLKQQLPRDGRRNAIQLIQAEEQSVSQDPRVRNAILGLAARGEAPGPTPPPDPVQVVESRSDRGDAARRLDDSKVTFSFTDHDVAGSTVLADLQRLCMNHGVTLSFASRRIEMRRVKAEAAVPRFVRGFRPAIPAGSRPRTYAMHDVPIRTVLQAVCLMAGLGYTVDRNLKAVVLVDADDPGAAWSPDPLPAARIAKALGSFESRRDHIGRTAWVEGEATTAIQGIADYIITLKDGVRVCLPQTPDGRARFEQIRNALGAGTPGAVQITAMGIVRPESSMQGVTIGGAVLLEVGTGSRYSLSPASAPVTPAEHSIHRLGE